MRILMFGPNGSGKGTQSSRLKERFGLAHIESGGIFRHHIGQKTPLGLQAKAYIDQGDLVPDSLTIPMVLDRLAMDDCANGWILDGFPRTPNQSQALLAGLSEAGTPLDAVIVIDVARETARARLLGRRNCPNGHANNTAIPAIQPKQADGELLCRTCDSPLSVRADDVDEAAIDKRLDIYFSDTVASIEVVREWADNSDDASFLNVDGEGAIDDIQNTIVAGLPS